MNLEGAFAFLSSLLVLAINLKLVRVYKTISAPKNILDREYTSIGLSILICMKGDAPRFNHYIKRIIEQKCQNFEIIVVYQNVSQDIKNKIAELESKHARLRFYELSNSEPYMEKKKALHYGISKAQYEWIVTIDDDCYPESDLWLSSIRDHILHLKPDILLGFSPYISQKGLLNKWIQYDAFQVAKNYAYETTIGSPYMGIGRNMIFKKEMWSESYLKKFHKLGSGDDSTLVQFYKRDKKIDLMISPKVYSFPKTSFRDWFYQKLRHIEKGKYMDLKTNLKLSFMPISTISFWFILWLWLSYFSFHFFIVFIAIVYLIIKTSLHFLISQKLGWKKKPIFYTFLFDFLYNFWILCFPILSIFIKRKWK